MASGRSAAGEDGRRGEEMVAMVWGSNPKSYSVLCTESKVGINSIKSKSNDLRNSDLW